MVNAMRRSYSIVFLGEGFDEISIVAFATEFRRVGLRVTVVGLQGQRAIGAYGIRLLADQTLGQVLTQVSGVACVVVPCDASRFYRYQTDPRLAELLMQAQANQAQFVVKEDWASSRQLREIPMLMDANLVVYPDADQLVQFAHSFAVALVDRLETV
jgi:hypothetical protein